MDKANLSKRKYIYRVYVNAVNEIHTERYRIAYMNSKYVYYIAGDKQQLECIEIGMRITESLEKYMEWNASNGRDPMSGVTYMYYWSISDTDPASVKKALVEKYEQQNRERAKARAETAVRIAEQELAKARQRLAEF